MNSIDEIVRFNILGRVTTSWTYSTVEMALKYLLSTMKQLVSFQVFRIKMPVAIFWGYIFDMNSCLLKNAETVSENQTANHPGSSHYRRIQPTEPGLCIGYDWKFSRLRIAS